MPSHILITESALDALLVSESFDPISMLPSPDPSVYVFEVADSITGYRTAGEEDAPLFALIGVQCLQTLQREGGLPGEVYRRIARVIKGLRSPPIHLPRQWSEYHYKNMLAFFALSRDVTNQRWVVDINGERKCARFDFLTSESVEVNLQSFSPSVWPREFEPAILSLLSREVRENKESGANPIAQEFDLKTIGSGSVVEGRTYEEWLPLLSDNQKALLEKDIDASIRIVGP